MTFADAINRIHAKRTTTVAAGPAIIPPAPTDKDLKKGQTPLGFSYGKWVTAGRRRELQLCAACGVHVLAGDAFYDHRRKCNSDTDDPDGDSADA